MTTSSTQATAPSVLLSLFGETVAEPPHSGMVAQLTSATTSLLCSDHSVDTQSLATLELAWAFWSLRQKAQIVLEPYERSSGVLFFKHHGASLRVRTVGVGQVDGIEGGLFHALAADPQKNDVGDVIHRWFRRDSTAPFQEVIVRVFHNGVEQGYVEAVASPRTGLDGLVRHTPMVTNTPDCARIAAARPAFEALLAEWRQFEASEPVVHRALLSACTRGIKSRQESETVTVVD